eukprot:c26571_g1_i2 orf=245-2032(-)
MACQITRLIVELSREGTASSVPAHTLPTSLGLGYLCHQLHAIPLESNVRRKESKKAFLLGSFERECHLCASVSSLPYPTNPNTKPLAVAFHNSKSSFSSGGLDPCYKSLPACLRRHPSCGLPRSLKFYFRSAASRSADSSNAYQGTLQQMQTQLERSPADIVQIEDGRFLYSGLTSIELLITLINLQLVSYEPVVDLSIKILKSPIMNSLLRGPILWMVKRTVFSHFCAGEDVGEASETLRRTWELGLRCILDYSLEDAMDNISCDLNLEGFLKTIYQTHLLPSGSVSFSCVKITAICPLPLLERISNLLRWQHKHASFNLPWKDECLPLLAPESPTYHVQRQPDSLSEDEQRDILAAKERLWKLCKESDHAGLPLLVDAEHTSVQPAIDYFTYTAALQFNRGGRPLIYGTIQAYLKDSFPRLALAMGEAAKRGVSFGVKLVRGAYLTRECTLSGLMGAPSPVYSFIEDTHKCYDVCAAFMLERAALGDGSVVLATHNFDSGRSAAAKAEQLGLVKADGRLQFAQLKGMADGLSLALAHAGFQVSKYLPFGPVAHVIPYLIRRAEENRGLLGNTLPDRHCIRRELKARCLGSTIL